MPWAWPGREGGRTSHGTRPCSFSGAGWRGVGESGLWGVARDRRSAPCARAHAAHQRLRAVRLRGGADSSGRPRRTPYLGSSDSGRRLADRPAGVRRAVATEPGAWAVRACCARGAGDLRVGPARGFERFSKTCSRADCFSPTHSFLALVGRTICISCPVSCGMRVGNEGADVRADLSECGGVDRAREEHRFGPPSPLLPHAIP